MSGPHWNRRDIRVLRKLYPHRPTREVAARCGHSVSSTYNMARRLGCKKSAAYLASPYACRLRRGDNVGAAYRFPKGNVPANKGLRRPGWHCGRMRETWFKKGCLNGAAQKNWVPISTEVLDDDGYLKRKVSDDRSKPARFNWRYVHVLLWEAAYGPVPRGYAIKFIDGDRRHVTLNNLCIVSRADLARLNSMWNRYPHELAAVIQLRGALVRQINRRLR
ncbi:MAG TPA: HNH endonuclease signature motif containing protein [Burkholderiaceae bacterium]|nr:HNH endonuclease signature motif containing protein [Burkholderiaceae bacterium]